MHVCMCMISEWSYVCCLAGFVNKTVLYDHGGLRFVLHGEGCKSGKSRSIVVIILLCRQGSDLGQPEMFSQVGCIEKRFFQTDFSGLVSIVLSYFCTSGPHLMLPQTMLFCINCDRFQWPKIGLTLPTLINVVFTGSWWDPQWSDFWLF
jgi:hypothetical protein